MIDETPEDARIDAMLRDALHDQRERTLREAKALPALPGEEALLAGLRAQLREMAPAPSLPWLRGARIAAAAAALALVAGGAWLWTQRGDPTAPANPPTSGRLALGDRDVQCLEPVGTVAAADVLRWEAQPHFNFFRLVVESPSGEVLLDKPGLMGTQYVLRPDERERFGKRFRWRVTALEDVSSEGGTDAAEVVVSP